MKRMAVPAVTAEMAVPAAVGAVVGAVVVGVEGDVVI
jgi:hypothetical protein